MDLIDKIVKATETMYERVDKLSNDIRRFEKSCDAAKLHVRFEMPVGDSSLMWTQDPDSKKGKRWRLMLSTFEDNVCRPFLERKIEVRLNHKELFYDFIKAFTHAISEIDPETLKKKEKEAEEDRIETTTIFELHQDCQEYEDDLPY
jgi:hypothetical protein